MAATPPPGVLSEAGRNAILEQEIRKYSAQGYRVINRAATTALLVKPKQFNSGLAILGLFLLVIGFVIYLLAYMGTRDQVVYLSVDERGTVKRAGTGPVEGKSRVFIRISAGGISQAASTAIRRR